MNRVFSPEAFNRAAPLLALLREAPEGEREDVLALVVKAYAETGGKIALSGTHEPAAERAEAGAFETLRSAIERLTSEDDENDPCPVEALYNDVQDLVTGGQLEEDHDALIDDYRLRIGTLRSAWAGYRRAISAPTRPGEAERTQAARWALFVDRRTSGGDPQEADDPIEKLTAAMLPLVREARASASWAGAEGMLTGFERATATTAPLTEAERTLNEIRDTDPARAWLLLSAVREVIAKWDARGDVGGMLAVSAAIGHLRDAYQASPAPLTEEEAMRLVRPFMGDVLAPARAAGLDIPIAFDEHAVVRMFVRLSRGDIPPEVRTLPLPGVEQPADPRAEAHTRIAAMPEEKRGEAMRRASRSWSAPGTCVRFDGCRYHASPTPEIEWPDGERWPTDPEARFSIDDVNPRS